MFFHTNNKTTWLGIIMPHFLNLICIDFKESTTAKDKDSGALLRVP